MEDYIHTRCFPPDSPMQAPLRPIAFSTSWWMIDDAVIHLDSAKTTGAGSEIPA